MTRVMAQGTFDILHPGHLHYFKKSAELGDELIVVIARDERLRNRKDLYFSHTERREIVESLKMVDSAHLGTTGDPFDILNEIEPDVITIGFDQPYDIEELTNEFSDRGHEDITLRRIGEYEPENGEVVSSSEIKETLREHSGEDAFYQLQE